MVVPPLENLKTHRGNADMSDHDLLSAIEKSLAAGLETQVFPRAETSEQAQEIVSQLRASDGALDSKLKIAGFTLQPIEYDGVEQACETCMYYLVRRKWCDLPELSVPVEPLWSCRLWRM
jgi:hypothetical protein